MKKIILASTSPRRKALLKQLGITFEVIASNFKEAIDAAIPPADLVKKQSLEKAKNVAQHEKNAIIIAADTLVVYRNHILGKPKDNHDAKRILNLLNGHVHRIITGFTVLDTDTGKFITRSIETKVFFRKATNKEIDDYVKTKEPLDKAGAYGIQEKGSIFIKKIEGDYYNVVGLPINAVVEELRKFGVTKSLFEIF